MRRRRRTKEKKAGSSVWRSYSDMMSGLLLLFVLIMAVCLMQAQKNYTEKLAEQAKLLKSQTELEESQALLEEQQGILEQQQGVLAEQESELENQRIAIVQQQSELAEKESEMSSQKMTLTEQAKMLEELQAVLEEQEYSLNQKESEINTANTLLTQKESEINEANTLLAQRESEVDEANILLAQRESELIANQEDLDNATDIMIANQEKLNEANALMELQQERIDQIIGIKAELIEELNEQFKKNDVNVQIDTETGAILLDASVLYEFGKSELTEEGKEILEEVLPVYCRVLLSGEHVDDVAEIIVDGYTDSVGNYLSNMKLSQERAYAVASYLFLETTKELDDEQFLLLMSKLSVNGKSSSNPILSEDGEEDADASRRVEIKFRLKDEEMISELQGIIEEGEIAA